MNLPEKNILLESSLPRGALSLVYTSFLPPLTQGQGIFSFFYLQLGERYSFTMADDVVNSMENMKLTTEEEEVITISDEGRLEAIEDCNLSLLGKFLMCKSFNKQAAKNTMRRDQGLEDSLCITEVGPNLFQFKFTSEFDLNRVFRGGPWTFDNQLLLLKQWRRGKIGRAHV